MKRMLTWLAIIFVMALNFGSVPIHATDEVATEGGPVLSDAVAVVLVIDNSGSMLESDPIVQRFTAARMVLELLTEKDYISIITFSDEANSLVPMAPLANEQLMTARDTLSEPPFASGNSDYQHALTQAIEELANVPADVSRRFMIFLTDGEPYLRDDTVDMEAYKLDLRDQVSAIGVSGVPVYTVGFGSSDQQLLEDMATLTKGDALQGDSSTVAANFFTILQELKNRYAVIDLSATGAFEPFNLEVDQYTSRVTFLLQDENRLNQVTISSEDGSVIAPAFSEDGVTLYHLEPNTENSAAVYSVSGTLNGSMQAARDTGTKLWITEPANHALMPLDSEIRARITQTGVSGEDTNLNINISHEGTDLQQENEVNQEGANYTVNLGQFAESGDYDLTATLYHGEQIISRTSSLFTLRSIPLLAAEILQGDVIWLKDEETIITASLTYGGIPVTVGLSDTALTLELSRDGEIRLIELHDEGEGADKQAGDGIFTTTVKPTETGDFTGILRADGSFEGESFSLSEEVPLIQVFQPGIVEVSVPPTIMVDKAEGKIDVQITNSSGYPEQINISANGVQLSDKALGSPAGETKSYSLSLAAVADSSQLELKAEALHPATIVRLDNSLVNVVSIPAATTTQATTVDPEEVAAEDARARRTQIGLMAAGGVLVVLLVSFLRFLLPRRRPKNKLRGCLYYRRPEEALENCIPLSGSEPMVMSIGSGSSSPTHVEADIPVKFDFVLIPLQSSKKEVYVELRCSPPGALQKGGELMTSTLLSDDNQFDMAGLQFRYSSRSTIMKAQQDGETGEDVLSGRL